MNTPKTSGARGSPSATYNYQPGTQLPPPDPKFGGVIGQKRVRSRRYGGRRGWYHRRDAPNVVLILLDDCGFGAPGTFGGVIPTPALDRIAENGLRYTNFHSTALCSPRARH